MRRDHRSGRRGNGGGRRRAAGRAAWLTRHVGSIALATMMGIAAAFPWLPEPAPSARGDLVGYAPARHFPICGSGPRFHCVVDGDTIWFQGERVRIADIDAPEIMSPQCAREAALAEQATLRLQQLLNDGPFELRRQGRDRDRYDRLLRTLHRDGNSLGGQLVAEGLARPWNGARASWCG